MNNIETVHRASQPDVESGELPPADLEDSGRERRVTATILIIISLCTLGDLVEDRFDGAPWSHVLSELTVVVIAATLAVYLLHRSRTLLLEKRRLLERELVQARSDAKRWQEEASQHLRGLSAAISDQLDRWKLSEAEKEISLLLLKGLSHKEIALLRRTTEQTVRQQAASLYQKSGLSGRTELSAFFLEDLLVPRVRSTKSESFRLSSE